MLVFINICKRALLDVKYHADGRECIPWDGLEPNPCLPSDVSLQELKIIYHKTQRSSLAHLKRRERGKGCKYHLTEICRCYYYVLKVYKMI